MQMEIDLLTMQQATMSRWRLFTASMIIPRYYLEATRLYWMIFLMVSCLIMNSQAHWKLILLRLIIHLFCLRLRTCLITFNNPQTKLFKKQWPWSNNANSKWRWKDTTPATTKSTRGDPCSPKEATNCNQSTPATETKEKVR